MSSAMSHISATAESTKALTGLVTVNNANKIATRLVYDTLRVELVWANRIEGIYMCNVHVVLTHILSHIVVQSMHALS
jgi:hypothetical protein